MHHDRTDAARRAAYSDVMDGFAVALGRHGLPAEDRARLLRCHRAAAEMADRRPLFTASGEVAPSGTTWAENWQRAGEAGGIRHLGLDHLTCRPLIHAGLATSATSRGASRTGRCSPCPASEPSAPRRSGPR